MGPAGSPFGQFTGQPWSNVQTYDDIVSKTWALAAAGQAGTWPGTAEVVLITATWTGPRLAVAGAVTVRRSCMPKARPPPADAGYSLRLRGLAAPQHQSGVRQDQAPRHHARERPHVASPSHRQGRSAPGRQVLPPPPGDHVDGRQRRPQQSAGPTIPSGPTSEEGCRRWFLSVR